MANVLDQQYCDLNNWTKNMTSFPVFENTYVDGVNTLSYQGGAEFERLYIPVSVHTNRDYTFRFKFCSPTGFSMGGYGNDGAFAFVRTSAPSDTEAALSKTNLAVSEDWDNTASDSPKEYTIQFNSGSYSTLYIALDFGYILDGVTATFVFSGFELDNGAEVPSEYLKSIESDGTQYINLEYTHTANTKIELDCHVLSNTQRDFEAMFGSRYKGYANNAFIFFTRFQGEDIPVYNRSGYETQGANFPYDQRVTLTCYQKSANWTAADGTSGSITAAGTANAGVAPLFLFDLNNALVSEGLNPDGSRSVMRVYSLKIYDSDTLKRHYVPALDSSGVAYLYEEVEGYAYYPATGNPLAYQTIGFYLVRSGSTLYTVTDGTLTALAETEVTASLFQTYGVDELPDASVLVGLSDPELLYWQDSTDDLPTLTASVTGTPPVPQVVVTEDFDMSDSTILGIESATVDASDDVLFALSFDGGTTWKAYDGTQWAALEQENSGMSRETFENIDVESWAAAVDGTGYRIRMVLMDTTSYVNSITIHYLNEEV